MRLVQCSLLAPSKYQIVSGMPPKQLALQTLDNAHMIVKIEPQVFGTSYSPALNNFLTFLQTSIYNIDVGKTKETPRMTQLNN